jgi:hypothetical protein
MHSTEVIVNADKLMEFEAARGPGAVVSPDAKTASRRAGRWRERACAAARPGATAGWVDLPLDLPDAPAGASGGAHGDVVGAILCESQAGYGDGTCDDTRDAPGDTRPQRALHDDALWALAHRAQGATLQLDFELRTATARQVFRRDFTYVSRQLHALEASRRVQGLDRALLNDALSALQRRADDAQALFARIACELEAALALQGHAGSAIEFTRPARFEATIVSPGARRFVDLVRHADDALCQVEKAWLLGALAPQARTGLVGECRRALLGFKDQVRDRRQAIGAHVREINAQRSEAGTSDRAED